MKKLFFISFFFCFNLYLSGAPSACDTLYFDSQGSRVQGYLYSSDIPNSPTLIFSQAFFETGDIWSIGQSLSKRGINVFCFDFRGCFNSGGKQSLFNSLEDLEAASQFLKSDKVITEYKLDTSNVVIGGYSYGGHISLLCSILYAKFQRVINISGGDLGIFANHIKSNNELKKRYTTFFESLEKPGGPVKFLYDDPIEELLLNQEFFSITNQVSKLSNVDILLIGGLDDSVVRLEQHILPLYRKLKTNHDIQLTCFIYQCGHSFDGFRDRLIEDLSNWILN